MIIQYYILENNEIKPVDLTTWATWMGTPRCIAFDKIGDVEISTVFLGIDHNWSKTGGPILFESMVFGGELDQEQRRYHTRQEALDGHNELVNQVKAGQQANIK